MIITKAKRAIIEVLTAHVKENNNQEWTTIPKGNGNTMIGLTIIEGQLKINQKHPMDYSIDELVQIVKALA